MAQELSRRSPVFDDMRTMRRLLDRWAGFPMFREADDLGATLGAPVDIYEKGPNLVFKAAMPGFDADDIDVNVADGVLTISAETKHEEEVEEESYHRREFHHGKIQRSFRLPANLDTTKVEATYEKGVLRVSIPRKEESQPRKISVTAAD